LTDPNVAIQTAIECLKDLGHDRATIRDRIAEWIVKAGYSGAWQDLPDKQKARLGQAMQKYFEQEFPRQGNPLKIGA
jgi:hypothetical protein